MTGNHCNYYSFGVLLMAVCYDVEEVMDHEKIDGYRVSAGIDADADCLRRGGGLEI